MSESSGTCLRQVGKRKKVRFTENALLADNSAQQVTPSSEGLLVGGYHIGLVEDTYPCLGGHPDIRY